MLPEDKKKAYNDAARAEGVIYKQELAKWELKMIRLGNLGLVRPEALTDWEVKKSKRRTPKTTRSKSSSDSDWKFGWCSEPPFDDTQQIISSTTKPTQISSQPDPPLPADDKHLQTKNTEEVPEVKLNLSSSLSSKSESDTTGESIKQLSNQKPAEPEPKPVPSPAEKPSEPSKDSVINKLKDFFKF